MRAYVLAGGLGTRLYPYSLILPKPLLSYGTRTIIEEVIERVTKEGLVDEVVVVVSGKEGLYRAVLGDNYKGVKIRYHASSEPLGTAGQLLDAAKGERGTFVCMYSDSIIDFKLRDALEAHRSSSSIATVLTYLMPMKLRYGVIEAEGGLVKRWVEKPEIRERVAVGGFIFEPRLLTYVRERKYGMNATINDAIKSGERVSLFDVNGFIDLGSKDVYLAEALRKAREYGEIP